MDSLRHLKASLSELDGAGPWGNQQASKLHQAAAPSTQASGGAGQTRERGGQVATKGGANINNPNCGFGSGSFTWNRGAKFFKKVTTAKEREPSLSQARNVSIITLLLSLGIYTLPLARSLFVSCRASLAPILFLPRSLPRLS